MSSAPRMSGVLESKSTEIEARSSAPLTWDTFRTSTLDAFETLKKCITQTLNQSTLANRIDEVLRYQSSSIQKISCISTFLSLLQRYLKAGLSPASNKKRSDITTAIQNLTRVTCQHIAGISWENAAPIAFYNTLSALKELDPSFQPETREAIQQILKGLCDSCKTYFQASNVSLSDALSCILMTLVKLDSFEVIHRGPLLGHFLNKIQTCEWKKSTTYSFVSTLTALAQLGIALHHREPVVQSLIGAGQTLNWQDASPMEISQTLHVMALWNLPTTLIQPMISHPTINKALQDYVTKKLSSSEDAILSNFQRFLCYIHYLLQDPGLASQYPLPDFPKPQKRTHERSSLESVILPKLKADKTFEVYTESDRLSDLIKDQPSLAPLQYFTAFPDFILIHKASRAIFLLEVDGPTHFIPAGEDTKNYTLNVKTRFRNQIWEAMSKQSGLTFMSVLFPEKTVGCTKIMNQRLKEILDQARLRLSVSIGPHLSAAGAGDSSSKTSSIAIASATEPGSSLSAAISMRIESANPSKTAASPGPFCLSAFAPEFRPGAKSTPGSSVMPTRLSADAAPFHPVTKLEAFNRFLHPLLEGLSKELLNTDRLDALGEFESFIEEFLIQGVFKSRLRITQSEATGRDEDNEVPSSSLIFLTLGLPIYEPVQLTPSQHLTLTNGLLSHVLFLISEQASRVVLASPESEPTVP